MVKQFLHDIKTNSNITNDICEAYTYNFADQKLSVNL